MIKSKRQVIAVALCIVALIFVFSPIALMLGQVNHSCESCNDCAICNNFFSTISLVKKSLSNVIFGAILLLFIFSVILKNGFDLKFSNYCNPVNLKVKLLN